MLYTLYKPFIFLFIRRCQRLRRRSRTSPCRSPPRTIYTWFTRARTQARPREGHVGRYIKGGLHGCLDGWKGIESQCLCISNFQVHLLLISNDLTSYTRDISREQRTEFWSIFMPPGSNDRGQIVLSCLFVCWFLYLSVCLLSTLTFFWTIKEGKLIMKFGMQTQLKMPFKMITSSMTLWPWLWPLY